MVDEADLRKRVHENLRRLASGEVARELAEEKRQKAAQKEILKKNKRRIAQVTKRLDACREELHGLQAYMDEMLNGEEDIPGMLEECDAAIEGCVAEIVDLENELELLRNYHVPCS